MTFKPFFMVMDLPFSIKQSETLVHAITVFNYMNYSQHSVVSVDRDASFLIDNSMSEWEGEKL